jgi:outer membrane protein, heavy metal efflux system
MRWTIGLFVMGVLGGCGSFLCGCASTDPPGATVQFPPAPHYPPDHRYTLDELIELSVHRNASLDVARYEAAAAQGLVDQVKALWLPALRWDAAGLVYNNNLSYKARALDLVTVNIPITGAYNFENSLLLSQIISTGGKRTSGLKQAKMFAVIKKLEVLLRQDAVAFDVANFYYLVCLANEIDAVIEDAVRRIRVFRQVAQGLNQRGSLRASDLDYLEADFFVLELEQLRIAAQAGRQQAYDALKQFVGIARDESLVLRNPSLPPPITLQEAVSVSTAVAKGFLHRPENQQVDLFTHIRQEQVKFAKTGFAPNVVFLGSFVDSQGNYHSILDAVHGLVASVVIDVPLYDPGQRAMLRQALGMEQASLAFQRQVEELITLEISVTAVDAQKALVTVLKAARAAEIAAQHEQASRQAYSRELIPASAVIVGIALNSVAELQHRQALYAYHNARARLNRVTANREARYGS